MTVFKKLAGKASALLNASGICSNNCIGGHCSGCGECCADLLPLTKGEIKRLRKGFFYMMVRQKKTIISIAHIAVQGW